MTRFVTFVIDDLTRIYAENGQKPKLFNRDAHASKPKNSSARWELEKRQNKQEINIVAEHMGVVVN